MNDQQLRAILAAWLVGDSNEIYPIFTRLAESEGIEHVFNQLPADLQEHLATWLAENASALNDDARRWLKDRLRRAYEEAVKRTDPDDLHDLLVTRGPGILTRELPYVVQACRWRSFDRSRRTRRELELDPQQPELKIIEDAFERVANDERFVTLRGHLTTLANVDVAILWRTAEGWDDARIAEKFGMTAEGIRQRRHRAIRRLQRRLGQEA